MLNVEICSPHEKPIIEPSAYLLLFALTGISKGSLEILPDPVVPPVVNRIGNIIFKMYFVLHKLFTFINFVFTFTLLNISYYNQKNNRS